jgi:hypothetical protein
MPRSDSLGGHGEALAIWARRGSRDLGAAMMACSPLFDDLELLDTFTSPAL